MMLVAPVVVRAAWRRCWEFLARYGEGTVPFPNPDMEALLQSWRSMLFGCRLKLVFIGVGWVGAGAERKLRTTMLVRCRRCRGSTFAPPSVMLRVKNLVCLSDQAVAVLLCYVVPFLEAPLRRSDPSSFVMLVLVVKIVSVCSW
jgi:hypothetical protein